MSTKLRALGRMLRFYLLPVTFLLCFSSTGAHSQTTSKVAGITVCCPNQFVTIDASTAAMTPLSVVGDSSFFFNSGVSAVDPANHRMFVIRSSSMAPTGEPVRWEFLKRWRMTTCGSTARHRARRSRRRP